MSFDLNWSTLCTSAISIVDLMYLYTRDLFYYDVALVIVIEYLFFDICKRIYDKKLETDVVIHHVMGLVGMGFAVNKVNDMYVVSLCSSYMLYEVSTIFLNVYFMKKTLASFLLFFTTYTVIRIVYGTYLLYTIIYNMDGNENGRIFPYDRELVGSFQCLNYYWYYIIVRKFYRRMKF